MDGNNEVDGIISRSRRHTSFVSHSDVPNCYLSKDLRSKGVDMCEFLERTPTCTLYVFFFDYLKFMSCTLDLTWGNWWMFLAIPMAAFHFSLIYVTMRYFFLPNYIMLLDYAPLSEYAFSFVTFGIFFFSPVYLDIIVSCPYKENFVASMEYARQIGDILRYFVAGILTLCVDGFRVEGLIFWANMLLLLAGYLFLIFVVRWKYFIYKSPNSPNLEHHSLKTYASSSLFFIVLIMLFTTILSYVKEQQRRKKLTARLTLHITQDAFVSNAKVDDYIADQSMDSDEEKMGDKPRSTDRTALQIWWDTVNGYRNLNESYKIVTIYLTPFYFLAACLIPVMDKSRELHGWCKIVVLTGYIALPILIIPKRTLAGDWNMVFVCSWLLALIVFVSTKSQREPNYVVLYALFGMLICSLTLRYWIDELDSLVWQFFSMSYNPMPDMLPLLFFSAGELAAIAIVLYYLMRNNQVKAVYGVTMSVCIYTLYMALPVLVFHGCYDSDTLIVPSASTESCNIFTIIILICTLFHISMSGFEFRVSLFLYMVTILISYFVYQWMTHYHWVHPFGTLHHLKAPNAKNDFWA